MDKDNSTGSRKVKTVSYWTQRRKIRAAVDEFLNDTAKHDGPENTEACEPEQDSVDNVVIGMSPVYADEVTEEINIHDSDDNGFESLVFDEASDSECDVDDVDQHIESQHSGAEDSLANSLVDWVTEFNIPQTAVTALLRVLQPFHSSLPIDARTLMHTPRSFNIKQVAGGGEYVHFGVQCGIEKLYSGGYLQNTDSLALQFNIDGIPLFKSTNTALWPILCSIKNSGNTEPFVVGIFCGRSKPSDIDAFLADFVSEMKILLQDGVELSETRFEVTVHSFVCDTPARAMIKNVKGPTGYFGCDKCETQGEWNGKLIFSETDARRRTDVRFDEMADEEHHLGPSALQPLPIGMVSQFPLDYLHLVCLGVMRRLMLCWLKGPLTTRLCARKTVELSQKLMSIVAHVQREFNRKPRSVAEILRWKATEFRQFLLYTGPVVLSGILSETLYNHFLLLSVAISLLANPEFCGVYCEYANEILRTFVHNALALYGHEMMVYNVHALVHLADDVRRFGSVDEFSAFPFENALCGLKS